MKVKNLFMNLVFSIIVTIFFLLLIELTTRVGCYLSSGNTAFLKWGFLDQSLQEKSKQQIEIYDGYFKMKKNKVYRFLDWASKPVHTNKHGFRGKDFSDKPQPHTIRIVALGESSTFCFCLNDDETWPFLLGQKLNQNASGVSYEVINGGIPYIASPQIKSMLEKEILGYSPNIVVLYAGHNNASEFLMAERYGRNTDTDVRLWSIKEKAKTVSLFLNLFLEVKGKLIPTNFHSTMTQKSFKAKTLRRSELNMKSFDRTVESFINDVRAMIKIMKSRGITPIIVTQAETAHTLLKGAGVDNSTMRQGYDDFSSAEKSYAFVKKRFESNEEIYDFEIALLMNHTTTEALKKIAQTEGVTLIDFRDIVRPLPKYMKTFVHLNEEGAELLADTLAPVILKMQNRAALQKKGGDSSASL